MSFSPEDDRALAEILVARSPNGVLVTAADGRIRMVNPRLAQMVPLVPGAIGRMPIAAIPSERLAEALESGREGEEEFPMRSGNRDLLVRVVNMGPGRGRLAILQDVTRLSNVERQKSEFVANVSHELRTPATAIAGYAETLLADRAELDPYVVEMVEVIHRNAQRLTELFEDLLHLSRIEAREGALALVPLHLGPICAEAVDKVRVLAEERRVTFQSFVAPELRIMGDREALGHVIGNLVSNAVKYSYEDGIVTVRAYPRGDRIALEVIDLGMGIDPSHHERIFERFYRVDKGRARAAGGTGLGLAIVKNLAAAMGAEIQVRSRPGRGSVFRLLLAPVATA